MEDAGGIPWVLIGIGIIVLGAVLAVGVLFRRSHKMTRGEKAAQREATARNFRSGEE